MHFRKIDHLKSRFLSENLEAIYELKTGVSEYQYKTIPNGIIGLTFLTSGSACVFENGCWEEVTTPCFYGLARKPALIKMSRDCRDISIGFKAPFLSQFTKLPLKFISDKFTNAKEVFHETVLSELQEQLQQTFEDKQIVSLIERFLINHFIAPADPTILKAYKNIAELKYQKVEQLSVDLNISSRTLLNKFNQAVGLTPKEIMKIFRINNSLNFKSHKVKSLTDLTYKLGYFDQAHFIHDFKDTLGITPEKYFLDNGLISDFYNSGRWTFL